MSISFITILLITYLISLPVLLFLVKSLKALKIIMTLLLVCYLVLLFLNTTSYMRVGRGGISIAVSVKGGWFDKKPMLDILPYDFEDFYKNIIMLLPLGTCVAALKQCKLWKCMVYAFFIGFGVSFCIEFIQYATPLYRFPQLSDLIFNTLSCMLGALYTIGIIKLKEKILKI